MTVLVRTVFTVRCHTCPAQYEPADARSETDARLLAAMTGWNSRSSLPGTPGGGPMFDYCPTCEVPE